MKRANLMITVTVMLLSGLAAAQLRSDDKLVAQVPFEFMVANRIVPAGQCEVRSAGATGRTLLLTHFGAKIGILVGTSLGENKEAAGKYSLVFHQYGSQYFLSGIKLRGSRTTYRLPENKAEAEMRAQNVPVSTEVMLASRK
ncbi:MAG TPA: hypothetical protein VI386_34715 [Candidatus Sulfotelmatobacter sp.]